MRHFWTDSYLSSFLFLFPILLLFYLQHPKDNLDEKVEYYDHLKIRETSGLAGCLFVCATIDTNGNIKRKSLFNNDGWYYKPISKNIIIEKENTIIIKLISGAYERYDKVVIE